MAKIVYPEQIEPRALEYKNAGYTAQEILYGLQADYPDLASQIKIVPDETLPPLAPKGAPLSGVGIAADVLAQALEKVYFKGREDANQDARIDALEQKQAKTDAVSRSALVGIVDHLQQTQALNDGTIKKLSPADSMMAIIGEFEAAGFDPSAVIAALPSGAKTFVTKRLQGLPTTQADEQALEQDMEEYDDAQTTQPVSKTQGRK